MLQAFLIKNGRLAETHLNEQTGRYMDQPVWIDVIAPTEQEKAWVEQTYNLVLPQPEHLRDIEASARFYEENDVLHLRSDFLLGQGAETHSVIVAFMLCNSMLFSVHGENLAVFNWLQMRTHAQAGDIEDCKDVLIDLYAMDVEYSADALEEVYAELEHVSQAVLAPGLSDQGAAKVLSAIAQAEDMNGRIRRNVMDTRRAISFLMRSKILTQGQMEESHQILEDINSLDGHTAFLSDKINFLMGSTVGFINVNQNKIVRLFSVVSASLLPPMLIASIYGMNFNLMPELAWQLGYPFALALMGLSVVLPFWYFRRKGWLK
jgi:magnesium transporter